MNQHFPQIAPALVDPFGRHVTYLRVSVTDRCDFRCVYCMSENMNFLPKADLLTLEELDRLCSAFVARGVRKLRLTGGEPLVRRGIMTLVGSLSRHLTSGDLDELTLTTNGSQLPKYARELVDHGVKRINVSLDTLDAEKFRAITRWGELDKVIAGIDAAQAAGLRVKINAVALKGVNEDEIPTLIEWAHGRGMELTLIEVMPLGDVGEGRLDQYLPLSIVRARLAERYTLDDIAYRTGGPARYVRVAETGGTLGCGKRPPHAHTVAVPAPVSPITPNRTSKVRSDRRPVVIGARPPSVARSPSSSAPPSAGSRRPRCPSADPRPRHRGVRPPWPRGPGRGRSATG